MMHLREQEEWTRADILKRELIDLSRTNVLRTDEEHEADRARIDEILVSLRWTRSDYYDFLDEVYGD